MYVVHVNKNLLGSLESTHPEDKHVVGRMEIIGEGWPVTVFVGWTSPRQI